MLEHINNLIQSGSTDIPTEKLSGGVKTLIFAQIFAQLK